MEKSEVFYESARKRADELLAKYPHNLKKAAKIFAAEVGLPEKVMLRFLQSRMLTNLGL